MNNFDIVIAGGGISGSIAAVAAARRKMNVLIIERNGYLGGTLTAAGVGPMMTFHAGDKQIIKGITAELIDRLIARGMSPGHIADTIGYVDSITPFDTEAMKHELEIMVLESGGSILYHTMLAGANVEGDRIASVKICNKSGLSEINAKCFIDATGDADLSTYAGVEYTKGREADGLCQPMSMLFKVSNVDIQKVKRYMKDNIKEFPYHTHDFTNNLNSERLSVSGFVSLLKHAQDEGLISFKRECILFFETNNPGEVIINSSRVHGCDGTDPWSLSLAEIKGRKQVRELYNFLKNSIPGFENSILLSSGPDIGVRSSRQICGLYTLNEDDILHPKMFEDTIAHSSYQTDIHNPTGQDLIEDFDVNRPRTIYNIPYRCLVNDKISNLITVGRCISATFAAQSAIRTSPTAGAIGHAGGIAASLSALYDIPASKVNIAGLRSILREQGAFLI